MKAKIYQPAKTAMQSGRNKERWLLEFLPESSLFVEPLMGWVGSPDTSRQIKMWFNTPAEAEEYAKNKGLRYTVTQPKPRKTSAKSYSANFANNRKISGSFAQQSD